jgi:hypothetical protein
VVVKSSQRQSNAVKEVIMREIRGLVAAPLAAGGLVAASRGTSQMQSDKKDINTIQYCTSSSGFTVPPALSMTWI